MPAFANVTDDQIRKLSEATRGLEFRLPFPPSVNSMYLNVAGRGRAPTPDYRAWKEAAGWELKAQKVQPFPARAILHIDIDETRKGDCSNRIKAVEDLLVTHGIIKDDSKKYIQRVSIGWEPITGCRVRLEVA